MSILVSVLYVIMIPISFIVLCVLDHIDVPPKRPSCYSVSNEQASVSRFIMSAFWPLVLIVLLFILFISILTRCNLRICKMVDKYMEKQK